MSKRHKVKCGRDVTKILKAHDCPIRNGKGSHRIGKLPDGGRLVYHVHGEFGVGMRRKIVKVLMAAGMLALFMVMVWTGVI